MTKHVVILLCILAGCRPAGRRLPTEQETAAVESAAAAWVAAGRDDPYPETQCAALANPRMNPFDPDGPTSCFHSVVRGVRSVASACLTVEAPLGGDTPQLVVHYQYTLEPDAVLRAVVHESLHYIRGCVLLSILARESEPPQLRWGVPNGYPTPGASDRPHLDRDLWGPIFWDAVGRIPPKGDANP